MSHPLEEKICVLRARVRRLVAVYGLCWIVAVVLGAVIVLGVADYLIGFQDPGLRVICSLLVLGAFGWTCYRYLYLPLFVRLSEVDLALRLQRRFPALEDRLVSAVEFLKQSEDDPVAGSPALRRAVVAQTAAETERLDFSEVLDPRPPLRAAMVTVSICLVAAILVVLAPKYSETAVFRLAYPFGVPWPQKTNLEVSPLVTRAAKGRPVQIRVVDAEGAKLPRAVRIHYRFLGPDARVTDQTQQMNAVDGAMVAVLKPVRPFSYRAEGGDDNLMPWHPVEVVEPPGLEAVRVTLIPPAYTGWPSEPAEGEPIRALVGTRVEISGRATRPLASAVLHLDRGRRIDGGPTDRQRRRVAAEFEIKDLIDEQEPGSVRFELVDQENLSGEVGWEIIAVPDRPPTVSIKRPGDTVFATPQAVVPLQVAAADDLALHQLALVFAAASRPEDARQEPRESVLPLYTGPMPIDPRQSGGLSGGAEQGDRREVEHGWELAALELTPGTELAFHVTATDYRPQTAHSQSRRLVVITTEQLQGRIADRQGLILAELARVLKMQQGSREQVTSLEIRLAEIGHLEQLDVDRLKGAELGQREVRRSLTSRSTGVPMHVLALLADLANNKIDSPDVRRRMQTVLSEIERLEREHVGLIGRELTSAIKSAQIRLQRPPEDNEQENRAEASDRDRPVAASLAQAGGHQDQVIASLQRLLEQLGQWDKYRRFHREISQLLRQQEELRGRTTEVGRRTLGKELKDLLPQEVADLKIHAAGQLELARQFDRIQQRMDQAAIELRQSDPLAAQTVADALAEARRLAISGQMLSAGGQVERNRIGQATAGQQQIAGDLQEVLDILANRRQHELARLVKKLTEAESELAEIERRQAELRKKMEASLQDSDQQRRNRELQRLSREQAELQQETEQMARRLERLLADQAGETTRQAAGQMGQAGQCAGQGNCQGACRAAEAAQEALRQARRQLAARRQQAQAELAMEQLVRLEDDLKHFRRRQQNILEETQRYAGLRVRGEVTRAQLAGLRGLSRQQGSLRTETVQMGDKLACAGAFQLTLSRAGQSMGRAAALLNRRQTGPATQEAEEDALGRLDLLLEALKKEQASGAAQPGGAGGGKAGQGGNPRAVQMLTELKLLKLLQEDVNLRTAELQKAVEAAEPLTDGQRRRYAALSEEQGQLGGLITQLLHVEREAPEDDPAGLPDVRPQLRREEPAPSPNEEEVR